MKPQLNVFNYSVVNQNDDTIDVNIDGYIVDSPTLEMYQQYWGDETSVSYKSFREQIPANCKTINLYVNSGGGHVGDAMAIHDYLADLEDKGVTVNREGRGIVASAATYLVMGKNSSLSKNCLFMIHEVSGMAYGNVSDMENQVKAMRKFNDMIVNFYADATGQSATVIGNMMKAETWMDATEAKNKGFVKNIGKEAKLTNSIKPEQWPFSNMAILNTYNSFISNNNDNNMDTTKITEAITNGFNALLDKLGLSNKKDDESVKNAFTDFSSAITNSLKEINIPDEAAINALVTTTVTNALKEVPESFKNAITEATKNAITKEDFSKEMTTLTNSLIAKLGNESGKTTPKNEGRKLGPANKYRGAILWNQGN